MAKVGLSRVARAPQGVQRSGPTQPPRQAGDRALLTGWRSRPWFVGHGSPCWPGNEPELSQCRPRCPPSDEQERRENRPSPHRRSPAGRAPRDRLAGVPSHRMRASTIGHDSVAASTWTELPPMTPMFISDRTNVASANPASSAEPGSPPWASIGPEPRLTPSSAARAATCRPSRMPPCLPRASGPGRPRGAPCVRSPTRTRRRRPSRGSSPRCRDRRGSSRHQVAGARRCRAAAAA